ncbi:hypothetical protein GGR52DRAFT_576213 [Hypoxylon sp. FL1284]|nr:hypothetical protein GGR52DRAFT_576213 [Hypoxylon sp. FL1284]
MSFDMSIAWECRDQADQAEIYYNHPLRSKVRLLEDENLSLKRLLRENGIDWQVRPKAVQSTKARITRSSKSKCKPLPHIPVEIQLKILSYALTGTHPIIDPLCRAKPEHLTVREKTKTPLLAINFLATCKAYYVEGSRALWANNSFIFTTPEALRNFAEVDLKWRQEIKDVNFRIIAKFYDDEERTHKISRHYHPDLRKAVTLTVHNRPRDNALARRGFRAYGWYQLIDFLTAMLPPFNPAHVSIFDGSSVPHPTPSPKLLPGLEKLRIDFVNFGDDMFNNPPPQLHELASHQLGCTLNEVVLTGLPSDDSGLRTCNELAGLLKDEGLLIDHAPSMIALKNTVRGLNCGPGECHYSVKVVRAMRSVGDHHYDAQVQDHFGAGFPTAPNDEDVEEPPYSVYHSCRTIWKRVPVKISGSSERKWMLFDRMSGLPWEEVEDEATMFDTMGDSDDESEEGMVCDNCGDIHPGAIPPADMMDLYDDL